MAAELQALIETAKAAGLEGDALAAFLRDERAAQREAQKREYDSQEAERTATLERERREHESQKREYDSQEAERTATLERERRQHELQVLELKAKQELDLAAARAASPTVVSSEGRGSVVAPKLPPFEDKKDDMDAYLHRYEEYATAHGWDTDRWASNLSALLRGSALQVYYKMSTEDSKDYSKLKEALLKRYRLTEAGFREKFRYSKPEENESFSQFVIRVSGYLDRWIELSKIEKSYDKLRDIVIREQVLNICGKELRMFIQERKPESLNDLTDLAESYLEVHGRVYGQWSNTKEKSSRPGKEGNTEKPKTLPNRSKQNQDKPKQVRTSNRPTRECWLCDGRDHISRDCPKKIKASTANASTALQCEEVEYLTLENGVKLPVHKSGDEMYIMAQHGKKIDLMAFQASPSLINLPIKTGRVKGWEEEVEVLRDTGCSGAVIRQSICEPDDYTGELQTCLLMDGSIIEKPVVKKIVDTPFYSGEVRAIAMECPVYDVVIGNISGARNPDDPDPEWEPDDRWVAGAVVTRAQKKRPPLAPLKVAKSTELKTTRVQLGKYQKEDSTLAQIREWIDTGKGDCPRKGCQEKFYWDSKTQLLMREYQTSAKKGSKTFQQVVLPSKLRNAVMEVAHDSILGGHLGTQKTVDRVLSNFYWPGLHADVTKYCQSCDLCQRTIPKGRTGKAPLGTMPIVGTPFTRVAMDLIGPLTPSARGHRWILTVVDCATRYPEAVPLKGIETRDVAEELVGIFSRVGVPAEILSDRGTQFTSDLMAEVSRLLSLKQLFTTPYHAMCNGQVEKFNGTLKSMLKKMSAEKPKDWDRYIPALLFAYREVPQVSLGFSPFELLYGRTVRGPMSILKDLWTEEDQEEEVRTTYQYVIELRERIEDTCNLAHEELRKSQEKQKKRYDKGARPVRLKVGDKALLLLPTESNKLLMQWKGPFKVVRKVHEHDYVLDVNGVERTFHANMLKKYVERVPVVTAGAIVVCCGSQQLEIATASEVSEPAADEEIIYCPLEGTQTWRDVQLASRLTEEQKDEAREVLSRHPKALTDLPGRTKLEWCDILLTDDEDFRLKPWPMPYALEEEMDKEVTMMRKMDIIEPSTSQYASPPVVVRKPDGSCRYCIDFRRLNSKTVVDAEPIPNQENILNRLGKAKYISKLDLSKGFWQIPIKKEDRHLTAFQTRQGLMQFKVMPFGLVNALAKFCRMARKLLQDVDHADSYVDDIIIDTVQWSQHLVTLEAVLQKLEDNGLTAKPSKCLIGADEVDALGHVVGDGCLKPQQAKIDKILSVRRPATKSELRSFLGMVGYYQKFVQNFATLAKPLSDMTRKGYPNQTRWDPPAVQAFEQLKQVMSRYPILRLPQFDKQFILRCDASQTGLGAVLLQEHGGMNMPVMYISRKLKEAETRYSTIERECLALVWATKRLHAYLYGKEFILETDHQPLMFLNKSRINNDRITRWALTMQMYQYRVQVIKGRDNNTADYLSRCGFEAED